MIERVRDSKGDLTPRSFAETYHLAHEILDFKEKNSQSQAVNLDYQQKSLASKEGTVCMKFQEVFTESIKSPLQHFEFQLDDHFKTLISNPYKPEECSIYVPKKQFETLKNLKVVEFNTSGLSEVKIVPIQAYKSQPHSVKFSSGQKINFTSVSELVVSDNLADAKVAIEKEQEELLKVKKFSQTQKHVLEYPFPEVYGGIFNQKVLQSNFETPGCTTLLKITCLLTFVMTCIALALNFTRCTFIDIFTGITFFANIYIWRIYNVFLMAQLIVYLAISIIIDLVWEIMRAVHFSSNYEQGMKTLRLVGLIFSFINIALKIVICILYWRLSKED